MNQTRDTTIKHNHKEEAKYIPSTSANSTDSGGSNKVTPDRPSPLKRKIKQQPISEGAQPPLSPPRRENDQELLSSPNQSYQHRFFPSTPQYDHIYTPAESPYSPFPVISFSATPSTPLTKRVRLADDVVFKNNRPYAYSPSPRKPYPARRAPSTQYSGEHTQSPRVGLPMTETQRKAARDVEKFQRKEYQYYNPPSHSHPPEPHYHFSPKMSPMKDSKVEEYGKENIAESITRELPEGGDDIKATAESSHLIENESNGTLSQTTSDIKQDTASEGSASDSKVDSKQSMKTSPPRNTPSKEERNNNANLITPSENDGSRKSTAYTHDSSYANDSPLKSGPSQPYPQGMYGSPSYYSQGGQYRYPPSSPVKNSVSRGYNYSAPPPPHHGAHPHYYNSSQYYYQNNHSGDSHHYYEGSRHEPGGHAPLPMKRMSGEEGHMRRSEGRSHPYYSAPSVTESFDSDSPHHARDRSPAKRSTAPPILKSSSYEEGGRHSRHSSRGSYVNMTDEYSHDPHPHYSHQPPYPPHREYFRPNESSYPPHRYPADYNPGPPPGSNDPYHDRAPYYGGRDHSDYYHHYPPYPKEDVHPLMRDHYDSEGRRENRKGFDGGSPLESKDRLKSSSPEKSDKKMKGDDSSTKASAAGNASPKSKPSTKAQAAIAAGLTEPPSASEIEFDIHNPPLHPQVPPSNEPVCPVAAGVNSQDVLCGRGGGTNTQIGNRRFRLLVQEFQPTYLLCRRKEKPLIARTIVLIVRGRGGRFLKKDDTTGMLFEVGDEKAEAKTSQALREGLDVRSSKHSAAASANKKKKDKNAAKKVPEKSNVNAPPSNSSDASGHREGPPVDYNYPYPPYYGHSEGHFYHSEEHQSSYTPSRKRSRPVAPSNPQQWYPYPSPPKAYNYPPPHQDYHQAFQPPQGARGDEEISVWEDDFSPPRPKKSKNEIGVRK